MADGREGPKVRALRRFALPENRLARKTDHPMRTAIAAARGALRGARTSPVAQDRGARNPNSIVKVGTRGPAGFSTRPRNEPDRRGCLVIQATKNSAHSTWHFHQQSKHLMR